VQVQRPNQIRDRLCGPFATGTQPPNQCLLLRGIGEGPVKPQPTLLRQAFWFQRDL